VNERSRLCENGPSVFPKTPGERVDSSHAAAGLQGVYGSAFKFGKSVQSFRYFFLSGFQADAYKA
jgi:hypothetical protein